MMNEMGFNHPQPLIKTPGDTRKQVSCVSITQLVSVIDGLTNGLGGDRETICHGCHMSCPILGVHWIFRKRRTPRYNFRKTVGLAAELHDALGYFIYILVNIASNFVEHFVKGDEVFTLNVP